MKIRGALLGTAAVVFALTMQPSQAPAWDASSTSSGIVEQAALSGTLHQHLGEMLGHGGGLFQSMRVPRADAPALYEVLDKLNPTGGAVPDDNGRQLAIAWLVAGAAIADTPAEHAIHHFYDPLTKSGAKMPRGTSALREKLVGMALREKLHSGGLPATEWLRSAENPMSVASFSVQLGKAVSSKTPAERERHTAAALLAAGAIVHVIADMGSPAHVRGDLESFFDKISGDETDVGSRFERLAAIAYGRLGVPRSEADQKKLTLEEFITAPDKTGLADVVAAGYFSKNTLPRSIRVKRGEAGASIEAKLARAVVKPAPVPRGPFNLSAARRPGGAKMMSASGVCLAHYHLEGTKFWFSLPDSCALEQITELLPLAGSYAAGVLDHLFRGTLNMESAGSMIAVKTAELGLGSGAVTAFWDDELGVRTEYAKLDVTAATKAGESLGQIAAPPTNAKAVAILYQGVDEHGEAIVASGVRAWPLATAPSSA